MIGIIRMMLLRFDVLKSYHTESGDSFRSNYTKKKKKNTLPPKYIPLYVSRLYGDLEAELDFPSCEISFCSPAGQLHHLPCFPILPL